ncbi:MAG: substrate-binding domain-containing protein [Limnohabitans sp.]|nr:substrate-binding domain-containing protein [Limnohabitans sp.]
MRKIYIFAFVFTVFIALFNCNKKGEQSASESILTGTITILVDETILPVIEDQKMVFESKYKAKINLIGKSETEIVKSISEGKDSVAILTRSLTKAEESFFRSKKIKGRLTPLATDGIAFISNIANENSKIDLNEIIALMQGKPTKLTGLVFDNANSSTIRYFKDLAKVQELPKEKIFSFKSNNEVIKFVSENSGMIGVVGVNWLMQPMPDFQEIVDKVAILEVITKNGTFASPTQDMIASGLYPVTREIKFLNYQGRSGLGMGFASFIAGQVGQRIILKSGLVPVRVPNRNIIIRKEILKK